MVIHCCAMNMNALLTAHNAKIRGFGKPACPAKAHSMITYTYLLYGLGRHFALMHDLDHKDLVITPPPAFEGFAKSPLAQLLHRLILDVKCTPAYNTNMTGFDPTHMPTVSQRLFCSHRAIRRY